MIASLAMYDRPETASAHDRLWALIRDGLRAAGMVAPDALTRGDQAFWPAWQHPDLTLSQTCGFPFRARLHPHVALVGTPDYGLPGCHPGHYVSVIVARADDLRPLSALAGRLAYNEDLSQSGWAAPVAHLLALGLTPRPVLKTGGHRLSAQAVADGRADLAAVDAVTWALMQRWDDTPARLREVARTAPSPGLPLIAAQGADTAALFRIVQHSIAALAGDDRETLHLRGLTAIPALAYLAVPIPPAPSHFGASD